VEVFTANEFLAEDYLEQYFKEIIADNSTAAAAQQHADSDQMNGSCV
jgi:hypothetical protein